MTTATTMKHSQPLRSPLRNVALQPAFMHNGAFVRLEDAIRYHLDAATGIEAYTTEALPADMQGPIRPVVPVHRIDPPLRDGIEEFDALVVEHSVLVVGATRDQVSR